MANAADLEIRVNTERHSEKSESPNIRKPTGLNREIGERAGDIAGDLGRGILAGACGTLAITAASTIDQLATEIVHARKERRAPRLDLGKAITSPWSFSGGVVSKVFGITPKDAEHERQLSIMAHWGYGSSWGLSVAALHGLGVRGIGAMCAVLAGQLGAEMFLLPKFHLFAPATQWGRRAVVSSVYQHMIYALAAVVAFEWLRPRAERT